MLQKSAQTGLKCRKRLVTQKWCEIRQKISVLQRQISPVKNIGRVFELSGVAFCLVPPCGGLLVQGQRYSVLATIWRAYLFDIYHFNSSSLLLILCAFAEEKLVGAGVLDYWWIWLLIALLLLLLILIILCCFCCQRRKGDTYRGEWTRSHIDTTATTFLGQQCYWIVDTYSGKCRIGILIGTFSTSWSHPNPQIGRGGA